MRAKINFKIAFFLGLILILFYSCEREGKVEEPLPFGPSSLTVLLNVSASLNVLTAGTAREVSTITATLKKYDKDSQAYNAETGETIIFEICDAAGTPINTGYFEGNASVVTAVTNANGTVTTTYYGPLATEIATYTTVYILATVAREGKESISESAPINIIRDVVETILNIYASPTVIYAGATRDTSTITATLTTAVDRTPLANWNIRFEIVNSAGIKIYAGYFDSNEQVVVKVTDTNGIATVTYYGPLALEHPDLSVGDDTIVYILVTAWLGEVSVTSMAPIYIYVI